MENETVKDRLISFIKFKGLNKNKFEALCGLSKRYVSNISVSIQPDKIKKISLTFPELNTGWLLSGEGEMLKEDVYLPDVLMEDDHKAPLKRILQLLSEEGISLEEFAQAVNSHDYLFKNALKWPFNTSDLLLGNDSAIRGWVASFCEMFPQYSKLWILLGKGDKYTFFAKGISEINQRISEIEVQQKEDKKTLLGILNHFIKDNQ
jgi:hypothetical protein